MLRSLVLTAIGAAAACSSSGQAPTGTSSQAAAGGASVMVTPSWAKTANFVGRLQATTPVSIQVHLAMHDVAGAKALLASLSDP
jgi:hypothetical protein